MFELTPDQVADAEACGVSFPAATASQVQRYAMQRKVFRVGGVAVLATRDGALLETAGTLDRLIAQGEQQRRDLAAWDSPLPDPELEAPAPPPRSAPRRSAAAAEILSPLLAAPVAPSTSSRPKPRPVPRSVRWLTAGAFRRGRMAQHWSSRGRR